MGFLRRSLSGLSGRKAVDFTDFAHLFWQTAAGPAVNEETALRYSAVWACIRVISEDVATIPLLVYRRDGRRRLREDGHPAARLLRLQPNPEMTAVQFRETLSAHVLAWGNAYAWILRDGEGQVTEMWPLLPNVTRPLRQRGRLWYETVLRFGEHEETRYLRPEDVLHISGLGWDGLRGYSPIAMHRQAIGLGLAAEEFGARFFGQGTHLGGFVSMPGVLSQAAYERLRQSLREQSGLGPGAHQLTILEEGGKFEKIGIPPDEAQFIELRQFQIEDIARIYRVPPHKIGHLLRATFSNIEEQEIDYVRSTLRPWLVRWEQAINVKIFGDSEYYAEHKIEGLLRGTTAARYQSYHVALQDGWMSRNEVRELENLDPIEGGDIYLEPLNMTPAGSRRPEEE